MTFSPKVTLARINFTFVQSTQMILAGPYRCPFRVAQDQPNPSEPFPYLVVRKRRGDWVKRQESL